MGATMDEVCAAPIKARPSPADRPTRRRPATPTPAPATDRARTGVIVINGSNKPIVVVATVVYCTILMVGWGTAPDIPGQNDNHVGNHGRLRSAGAVTSPRIRTPPATTTTNTRCSMNSSTQSDIDTLHVSYCPGGAESLNIENSIVGHSAQHERHTAGAFQGGTQNHYSFRNGSYEYVSGI